MSQLHNKRNLIYFIILSFLVLLFFMLNISLGSIKIPIKDIFKYLTFSEVSEQTRLIIYNFRLPKAITAVIAGAALSISGLQMQTIFRNPLAGPYILGISSGASLGVALVILGFGSLFTAIQIQGLSNWLLILASWLGSAFVLSLILAVSAKVKDIMTILILGILFGSVVSAIVSIMQFFSNASSLKIFVIWTMGSLSNTTMSQLQILIPVILFGLLVSLFSIKILNTLLLGENYAYTLGLNLKFARIIIFISTSILAGSITAFCGPIGFIGIMIPHMARMIFKSSDHNFTVPASILLGAIILLISDIIAQLPGFDQSLPINSITAICGIPFIIWLILKKQKIVSV